MASLKVTYEAPPGLKKNLQRTYEAWTPDFIAEGGSAVRAQLLFVLAWFHAIVQERRTFVPQVRVKRPNSRNGYNPRPNAPEMDTSTSRTQGNVELPRMSDSLNSFRSAAQKESGFCSRNQ
jgi:hypothetical protein